MSKQKTIREHLQQLLEPYRSQALMNMWWEDINTRYDSARKALYQAFNWSRSPQGYDYWSKVQEEYL